MVYTAANKRRDKRIKWKRRVNRAIEHKVETQRLLEHYESLQWTDKEFEIETIAHLKLMISALSILADQYKWLLAHLSGG